MALSYADGIVSGNDLWAGLSAFLGTRFEDPPASG
jgi:hypothetical protein